MRVGLYGFGPFGRFLYKYLKQYNFNLIISDIIEVDHSDYVKENDFFNHNNNSFLVAILSRKRIRWPACIWSTKPWWEDGFNGFQVQNKLSAYIILLKKSKLSFEISAITKVWHPSMLKKVCLLLFWFFLRR